LNYKPSVFSPFLRRFTDEIARDLSETRALYHAVHASHQSSGFADPDVLDRVHNHLATEVADNIDLPLNEALLQAVDTAQRAILAEEATIFSMPEIRWEVATLSMKEQVDLRRFLRAKEHFLANQERVLDILGSIVGGVFVGILRLLPPIADAQDTQLRIPLLALLPNIGDIVEGITGTIIDDRAIEVGLFRGLQERLYENACIASGVMPDAELKRPLITAGDSDLPPEELVDTYLVGTPFRELFFTPVPFAIPDQIRFEHSWLCAGSGHGKTNALATMIENDLEAVARDECSVVVIDSQNQLIPQIAGLKVFAEGAPLHGRLVHIDPSDIEYPVQLNLFAIGKERLDSYSLLERERLLNSVIELYDFVLSSLLGSEMTARQGTLFRFATQLMMVIPDATIHTFRELMQSGGYNKYRPYIDQLGGTAKEFFETQFNGKIFEQTKQQVVARLFTICENRTFERLFTHPQSKLDLFTELNSGKVILINTAKDLLKQQGTEVFGRFFLALIGQAAQERATLSNKKPVYCYIDECQDYIASDSNFTVILEQARKQKIGMIVAHQYLSQLSQRTLDSLYANTSTKFVGGVSDKDAYALARNMATEPAFVMQQSKGTFTTYVRNYTKKAVALKFPLSDLPRWPSMTPKEQAGVRAALRAQYAVPLTEVQAMRAAGAAPAADEPSEFADSY
jgi:hypothetical protein